MYHSAQIRRTIVNHDFNTSILHGPIAAIILEGSYGGKATNGGPRGPREVARGPKGPPKDPPDALNG